MRTSRLHAIPHLPFLPLANARALLSVCVFACVLNVQIPSHAGEELQYPEKVPPELRSLIRDCLSQETCYRPDMDEIVEQLTYITDFIPVL